MQTIKNNGGEPKPTANLTINKNRAKVYDNGTYYLRNGQTFEIELFNPTKSKIRGDIKIDGRIVSGGGLILNPGERVYLERFVETNNKFLFETYEIEDSKEAQEATSDNGSLTVEFFKESVALRPSNDWVNYGFDPSKHPDYYKTTYWGNLNAPVNPFYSNDFNVTTTGSGDFTVTPTYNSTNVTNLNCGVDPIIGLNSSTMCFYSSDDLDTTNYIIDQSSTPKKETGRTERGEASNQSFETVSASFNYLPFETVVYSLLPVSKMEITSKDLAFRHYCHECGSKIKSQFKFCPKCGEKL